MQIVAQVNDDLEVETWIDQMIAENGYAQISMHDPSSGLPGFAYTIGLERSRQVPELSCMGVAPDIAAQIFAICVDGHDAAVCDIEKENHAFEGLVEGYTLRFRRVASALVLKANLARAHRRKDISRMVQVLLPDNNGYFPGDPECDPGVFAAQDPDRLLAPVAS